MPDVPSWWKDHWPWISFSVNKANWLRLLKNIIRIKVLNPQVMQTTIALRSPQNVWYIEYHLHHKLGSLRSKLVLIDSYNVSVGELLCVVWPVASGSVRWPFPSNGAMPIIQCLDVTPPCSFSHQPPLSVFQPPGQDRDQQEELRHRGHAVCGTVARIISAVLWLREEIGRASCRERV